MNNLYITLKLMNLFGAHKSLFHGLPHFNQRRLDRGGRILRLYYKMCSHPHFLRVDFVVLLNYRFL